MNNHHILAAVGDINDNAVLDAKTWRHSRPRRLPLWAYAAACLCILAAAIAILLPEGSTVTAYAYGADAEITSAGAIMSTGTINDSGEITGHPLMFFLSGKNIDSVRFSCKNQMINFMDWTEKRDEYGNAQNFTVPYGEEESEYYFLLIDWVPTGTIRELTNNAHSTIASLPAALREDTIVMEIAFADGKTAVKAIHISLRDDGTFFAAFDDYNISEADCFVRRPDSTSIPRDILYGVTEAAVSFHDKAMNEVSAVAGWYNMANIDSILVKWTGAAPNTVRMYYTPAGTETAEDIRLLMAKVPADGENHLTFSMAEVNMENMYGHLEIELSLGGKVSTKQFNVIYDIDAA